MAEEEAEEEPPNMNRLPNELLFDIFTRFPPKALCRLRCVCFRWSSILTTDPDFIPLYHRSRRLNPLLFIYRRRSAAATSPESDQLLASCHSIDAGARRFNITAEFPTKLISILSCRGIVCFISKSKAFLYDPVTGRASNLTGSPNFNSSSSAALGYSAITREFKLLNFYVVETFDNYHYEQMKELWCEILTFPERLLGSDSCSESHEWRSLGRCYTEVIEWKSNVCIDGSVFWLVKEKKYNHHNIRILSFELESEEFGVDCFPRRYSNRAAECLDLLELKEKLCLTDRLQMERVITVWESKDRRNNEWTKKHVIDVAEFMHMNLRILGYFCSSIGGGEGEGELVMKAGGNQTRAYNLEKGTFREIEIKVENGEEEETIKLELLLDRKNLL